jgi:hypothetical protein
MEEFAQSFIVGISGLLTGFDLRLAESPYDVDLGGSVVLSVLPTTAGTPATDSSLVLNTVTIEKSTIPLWNINSQLDFLHIQLPTPVAVNAGDVLQSPSCIAFSEEAT